MATFIIKQNDTSPSIVATLTDINGTAINVTGASVRFHMKNMSNNSLIIDQSATIVTAASGIVRYAWQSADTQKTGLYSCEFEVTYTDNSIETFPNDDKIIVSIESEVN
jgi:hypothetical protein